jgi:hypothetical protein
VFNGADLKSATSCSRRRANWLSRVSRNLENSSRIIAVVAGSHCFALRELISRRSRSIGASFEVVVCASELVANKKKAKKIYLNPNGRLGVIGFSSILD